MSSDDETDLNSFQSRNVFKCEWKHKYQIIACILWATSFFYIFKFFIFLRIRKIWTIFTITSSCRSTNRWPSSWKKNRIFVLVWDGNLLLHLDWLTMWGSKKLNSCVQLISAYFNPNMVKGRAKEGSVPIINKALNL